MPLYVQDFLTDEKLNECSAAATGVYIKILCLMHKSPMYGTISLGQKHKQTVDQIKNFASKFAGLFGFSIEVVEDALRELIREDVVQLDGETLRQKRMFRDGEISLIRSETGSLGGKRTRELFSFGRANDEAKSLSNTDIDNEDEIHVLLNKEFEVFWSLYDKKVGNKPKLLVKWGKLTKEERRAALEYVPKYKEAQPDKQFRKNPETFINNKSWLDEIISSNGTQQTTTKGGGNKFARGANQVLGKLKDDLRQRGDGGGAG